MPTDVDNQELAIGDRVVSIDRVNGIQIKVGEITGFTAKQAKILFDHDPKVYGKQFDTIAKIFKQD